MSTSISDYSQMAEGSIPPLSGAQCSHILAVSAPLHGLSEAYYLLLQVEQRWYRLFIDVGVLFISPTHPPSKSSHEDDGERLHEILTDATIQLCSIANGIIDMELSDGRVLEVSEDSETSMVLFRVIEAP